eukprot:3037625-Rhodomonas_salina.1
MLSPVPCTDNCRRLSCYDCSGTALAYRATAALVPTSGMVLPENPTTKYDLDNMSLEQLEKYAPFPIVLDHNPTLSSYACATTLPRMDTVPSFACYAMRGTDLGYAATSLVLRTGQRLEVPAPYRPAHALCDVRY